MDPAIWVANLYMFCFVIMRGYKFQFTWMVLHFCTFLYFEPNFVFVFFLNF